MVGEARLRGQSPAQEALMRPSAKGKGAAAPCADRKSAAHERNALSSHGLPPQYFRRGGA